MYVGRHDLLAAEADASWALSAINGQNSSWPVVHYRVIDGGHETLLVAKDMSYFKRDAMTLIKKYNPSKPKGGRKVKVESTRPET